MSGSSSLATFVTSPLGAALGDMDIEKDIDIEIDKDIETIDSSLGEPSSSRIPKKGSYTSVPSAAAAAAARSPGRPDDWSPLAFRRAVRGLRGRGEEVGGDDCCEDLHCYCNESVMAFLERENVPYCCGTPTTP